MGLPYGRGLVEEEVMMHGKYTILWMHGCMEKKSLLYIYQLPKGRRVSKWTGVDPESCSTRD